MKHFLCLASLAMVASGPSQDASPVKWDALLTQPGAWYGTPEATRIADDLLLYQRGTGGWPKNADMTVVLTAADRERLAAEKAQTDSTIDNGATTTEIQRLARVPGVDDGARKVA